MKNLLIVIAVLFTLGRDILSPTGQAKIDSNPDFSGIWSARVSEEGDPTTLKVSYQNPKLKISRTTRPSTAIMVMGNLIPSSLTADFVYYVDGRGERNKFLLLLGSITSGDVESKTELVGQSFRIHSSFTSSPSSHQSSTDITYTLDLSPDGNTLNLGTTLLRDGVKQEFEQSYERSEGKKGADINGRWTRKPSKRIVSLIILHHDPEVRVTRREESQGHERNEDYIYYSDGRGESNVEDEKTVKSVTKWEGNSLLITVSSLSRFGDDNINFWRTVRWQVSKDGKNLVETSKVRTRASVGMLTPDDRETKTVFTKRLSALPNP